MMPILTYYYYSLFLDIAESPRFQHFCIAVFICSSLFSFISRVINVNSDTKDVLMSNDSESESECEVETCVYCKSFDRGFTAAARIFPQAFHGDCDRCASTLLTDSSLCSFWTHLRLRHLYECLNHRSYIVFRKIDICQECPACQAIRMRIARREPMDQPKEGTFDLEFDLYSPNNPTVQAFLQTRYSTASGNWKGYFPTFRIYLDDPEIPNADGITVEEKSLDESDWRALRSRLQCSTSLNYHGVRGLRVIDVRDACVTVAPLRCEYIALSYVWGASGAAMGSLKATSTNIKSLETPGYLNCQEIPATIRDAMTACEKLCMRYLWVDRLCILQDNPGEMIKVMDKIYRGSVLTIIASDNDDALQGLPGISRGQMLPFKVRVSGMRLVEDIETHPENRGSMKWKTRGWTYQEEYFSRRLLYIGKYHPFLDVKRERWPRGYFDWIDLVPHISRYSRRDLTSSQDKVAAFMGMLNSIVGENHLYGIPFREFDDAILWTPMATSRNSNFPSWSWASARAIEYNTYHYKCLGVAIATWSFYTNDTTLGSFVKRSVSKRVVSTPSCLRLFWGCRDPSEDYGRIAQLLHATSIMAWREGCFPRPLMPEFNSAMSWEQLSTQVYAKWPTYDAFWQATRPQNPYLKDIFAEEASKTNWKLRENPGKLLVHTQYATLNLERLEGFTGYPRGPFLLRTGDGILRGWAYFDNPKTGTVYEDGSNDSLPEVEVLALSVARATEEDWDDFQKIPEILHDQSPVLRYSWLPESGSLLRNFVRSPLILLNIMLVKKHNGRFCRVGLGKAMLKGWKEVGTEFKIITLD